jgi:ABC-type sulfate/molybdate transport systems ATPase subunit
MDKRPRSRVSGLAVTLGAVTVLRDVSLIVYPSETLVVLGGSGSGKTTLLKVMAGLQPADSGSVYLDEVDLQSIPLTQRRVVYLDQEALLFEHLTVFENIAFSLRLRRVPTAQVEEQVDELLEAIGLSEHAGKRSWQLSGGQKQRIAFARAILAEPRVLLLDEPFGSLDARTRAEMQQLYQRLAARYRFTALLVTHDVREALVLGDRFAIMAAGELHCYESRAAFVADKSTGVQEEIAFWKQI